MLCLTHISLLLDGQLEDTHICNSQNAYLCSPLILKKITILCNINILICIYVTKLQKNFNENYLSPKPVGFVRVAE